jgi:hypothetical protein
MVHPGVAVPADTRAMVAMAAVPATPGLTEAVAVAVELALELVAEPVPVAVALEYTVKVLTE